MDADGLGPLPEPFIDLHKDIVPAVYAAWADQMRAYAAAQVAAERARWIALAHRCVDAIDAYEACAYGPPPRQAPMLRLRADLVAATAPGPVP